MSNKKKSKIAARILAIVLCVLMVVSMAFYTIYMIVDNIKAANGKNENQGEQKQATTTVEYTINI